ncbi:MAG TPA: hypothetical protein VGW33_12810, partial [Terriglobia bacterium]|nr:hypothetical protein [Terriglobia bacterium]
QRHSMLTCTEKGERLDGEMHSRNLLVNAPKPPQFLRLQPAHVPPLLHIGATFLGETTFRLEYQHEML